jgi:AbrB family looped-hinge helix DNA binding protein
MPANSSNQSLAIEATVTSKGQITLPKVVRTRLAIQTGTRIRFTLPAEGGFQAQPVLLELEELWKLSDATHSKGAAKKRVMTFAEMNRAKARRVW